MANNREATALAAERRIQAFELRKAGVSYRQIAEALRITHTTARRDVEHVLADLAAQSRNSAEQYRAMHLERLNDMMLALWPSVKRGDQGAIREARACMEREAKLLGLDLLLNLTQELPVVDEVSNKITDLRSRRLLRAQG